MYIFYDFETSTRELLGQILSYAFIVVDEDYNHIEEFCGTIKLNRTQLPDIDAILVNKLDLDQLNKMGDCEREAAKKIHHFLERVIQDHGFVTLCGYNSNRFDLDFLRNLMIRYGLNPYFRGRIGNLDMLHFVQHVAFSHPEKFPWVLTEKESKKYYSFRLEDMATAFNCLSEAQSHDAREDVVLTITLAKVIETQMEMSFLGFKSVQMPVNNVFQGGMELGKQKVRHFPEAGEALQKFSSKYWVKLFATKSAKVVIDLEKFEALDESPSEDALLSCLRYINHNKQFFILESLSPEEGRRFEALLQKIYEHPFLKNLTLDAYFELIEKPWDIEYQIHKLGFERIDQLHYLIQTLLKNPETYLSLLKDLVAKRQDKKDNYLIQLFNRVYLNYHPKPDPNLLQRYGIPRYVTGTMLRNPEDFVSFEQNQQRLEVLIKEGGEDIKLLTALQAVYQSAVSEGVIPSAPVLEKTRS